MSIMDVISEALALTGNLEREKALHYLADSARLLTGAEFSAISVLDSHGETMEFIQSGMDEATARELGRPPRGHGLFHRVPAFGYLIVNDLPPMPRKPHSDAHPQLNSFLGVSIPIDQQVWGRLYLTNKAGGFTDDDGNNMRLLARATAIAVTNSRLYAQARNRAGWLNATQHIVSALLEGTDEDEALEVITHEMRLAAEADAAVMVLPSINNTWVGEIVDGDAGDLLGVEFPPNGRAQTTISEQSGMVIDSMQRLRTVRLDQMRHWGPALYAPLIAKGVGKGVIILLRRPGKKEFNLHDLAMGENAAKQAAIALELAEARFASELASELDQRSRISRDLHDLAIQQLFASGMHITAVKEDLEQRDLPHEVVDSLDHAIKAIDDSVSQIRAIVRRLRDSESSAAVAPRLADEASKAREMLGFAPSLIITWNGKPFETENEMTLIDDAVGADIADDVVAVVREGLSNAARHAHASSVSVHVDASPHELIIEVADDGEGITPTLGRRSGTSNLAARARRHRGEFVLGPRPDGKRGTLMKWSVPLH
ncbi:GAF domain-containing sensor histidine kinase [Arcanobacterium canis]|uniref:GAF domain-containing protein n=1 Tax=Arcanobacterium canis TaxID=999183 RepID=A0ABY8G188_9ACTO|nr:GAF domain-containing protein [Arcanobacterium canis]WFM83975.1 GAF domain-containing protein [Arcanobacterium canis]